MDTLTLAENLKELRSMNRLTQDDIAKMLGVSVITIGAYENGRKIPRLEKLIRLADYFGISLDNLVRGKKIDITSKGGDLNFIFPENCSSDWIERMLPKVEKLIEVMKAKQAEL